MVRKIWLVAMMTLGPVSAFARNGENGYADSNSMGGYGHMMNGYGSMMDFWGGHFVTWILFFVAVAVVVYFIVKLSQNQTPPAPPHESALDILKKRYARGELTKEQFDQIKKDL